MKREIVISRRPKSLSRTANAGSSLLRPEQEARLQLQEGKCTRGRREAGAHLSLASEHLYLLGVAGELLLPCNSPAFPFRPSAYFSGGWAPLFPEGVVHIIKQANSHRSWCSDCSAVACDPRAGFFARTGGTKKPSPFSVDMEGICNPGSTGSHKVATERAVRKQIRYLGTWSATDHCHLEPALPLAFPGT